MNEDRPVPTMMPEKQKNGVTRIGVQMPPTQRPRGGAKLLVAGGATSSFPPGIRTPHAKFY